MLKPLEYLYFIIGAIEVYAEITNNELLRLASKPPLMIVLLLFYARNLPGPSNTFHKVMIAALVFSWIGDVSLMFMPKDAADLYLAGMPKNPNFFLAGLGGFLITHILYALAFSKVSDKKAESLLPRKFWVIGPLLIYMVALLSMVVPGITAHAETKPFLIPVLIYSTAIAAMVAFSINRYKRVNDPSFVLVAGGALLFMFSDSIIAVSKFMSPFPMAGVLIMVLYIIAQYLIAKGCLRQRIYPD